MRRARSLTQRSGCRSSGSAPRRQALGALLGLGIGEITCYHRPRVGIRSTGDEVVPPEQTPSPGQIRDMNSYALAAMVAQVGAIPHRYGIIPDELDMLATAAA